MNRKNIVFVCLGLLSLCFIVVGATFAFFSATSKNNNTIKGNTYGFSANLVVSTVKSGKLVPTLDTLISTSVNDSDMCESSDGFYLCNVYQVTLTNGSNASVYNGDIKTKSGTTYTTNNVKYQLFELVNSTYVSVSDINNLSHTTDAINTFKVSNSNLSVSLSANQSKVYYLVVWLGDTGANQLEDANKKYLGTVEFYLDSGKTLTADFVS